MQLLKIDRNDFHMKEAFRSSFCNQFEQLLNRNLLNAKRTPSAVIGRFFIAIFFGFLLMGVFWQTAGDPISFTEGPIPKPQIDTVMT
jgi:hypothetical protein